jgi:hypothetical protein
MITSSEHPVISRLNEEVPKIPLTTELLLAIKKSQRLKIWQNWSAWTSGLIYFGFVAFNTYLDVSTDGFLSRMAFIYAGFGVFVTILGLVQAYSTKQQKTEKLMIELLTELVAENNRLSRAARKSD